MIDERSILARLQSPSTKEEAFTALVREYQEPLYWQIRRMVLTHEDADDVLQNALIKAWTAIDSFRGDAKLSTWLFRIAVNESLNHLEKKKTFSHVHADESSVSNMLMSDPYFDGNETQAQLQEAITTLPNKQRIVFNMKYFQEMKYEEMSSILGTSIGALKASYHHAVTKITAFFELND